MLYFNFLLQRSYIIKKKHYLVVLNSILKMNYFIFSRITRFKALHLHKHRKKSKNYV